VTQSFLFGVTPASPHVFLIPAAVLALAALVAMVGPARTAGKLDPVAVLRD
jgi:ABC-type antimicrobial peptide transport system permease subunit